jgi:hypothetical protein
MRCDMAASATLALETALRCDAASAKMECMRYSYCQESDKLFATVDWRSTYVVCETRDHGNPYLIIPDRQVRIRRD